MSKYRWDLEHLLGNKTLEEFYAETFKKVDEVIPKKENAFDNIENFREWHILNSEMYEKLYKLYNYIWNKKNENVNEPEINGWYQKLSKDNSLKIDIKMSNLENIIISKKIQILEYLKNEELSYLKKYYDEIFKYEKYRLTDEEELLLSNISSTFSAPSQIFSSLMYGDLKYDDVLDSKSEPHKLTRSNKSLLLQSKDRTLRKNAYLEFDRTHYKYKNTLTKTLYYNYLSFNKKAKIRGYEDYISQALFDDYVTKDFIKHVYFRVQKYRDSIAVPLEEIINIIYSKKLKIDVEDLEPWDLHVPLYEDSSTYSIEEAQDIVLNSLKPLGEEYTNIVKKAYEEKWIDYEQKIGKRDGPYSISETYGISKYYILMSFNNTFSSIETLSHELGHSVNSYYLSQKQPFEYSYLTSFTGEVASTVNESLLFNYMLSRENENNIYKIDILLKTIKGFLISTNTQIRYSEFEWRANELINKNESFTADSLMDIVKELTEKYEPSKKDKFKEMPYTKMYTFELTMPHFYNPDFYVYKYATGQIIATIVANKILSKEEGFAEKYKEFLSSGNSKSPLETIKILGIDLTKPEPWEEAGKFIQGLVRELGDLVEKTKF